jgi:hypothetical protein
VPNNNSSSKWDVRRFAHHSDQSGVTLWWLLSLIAKNLAHNCPYVS